MSSIDDLRTLPPTHTSLRTSKCPSSMLNHMGTVGCRCNACWLCLVRRGIIVNYGVDMVHCSSMGCRQCFSDAVEAWEA